MAAIRILLVEDDPTIANVLRFYLEGGDKYETVWVRNAGEAVAKSSEPFDIILLDVMLPDVDGVSLCATLRQWQQCPIIFISCDDSEDTIIASLKNGGDDYLVKPFSNQVLEAHIQANLRRTMVNTKLASQGRLKCSGFVLNTNTQSIERGGTSVALTPIEFKLLLFFLSNPNQSYTANKLYGYIWGDDSLGDVRTVAVHIHTLRGKLEEDPAKPRYICSIPRKGYLFDPKGGTR